MIEDDQLIGIGPWPKGLDNVTEEVNLPGDRVREAENIAFTKTGHAQRRGGYVKRATTTDSDSLKAWNGELVYVDNGALVRREVTSFTANDITTVNNDLAMSYAETAGRLYFTNGIDSGYVGKDWVLHPWGVPNPVRQPEVTAGYAGSLVAGIYQVAVTFIASDGEESGTGPCVQVTVGPGEAIQLDKIPQTNDAEYVRIYLSQPNGDVPLWQTDLAMGITSYRLYSLVRSGVELQTQFCAPMPKGQICRYWRGHVFVVKGNVAFWSEPLRYGLYRPLDNYTPPTRDRIVVFEPVEDGIWVVTEKQTWFYGGTNPAELTPVMVYPHGGTEGSGRQVDAKLFNAPSPGMVAYWWGERGGVLGLTGGQLQAVMEDQVAVDEYEYAATGIFEKDGIRQMITTVRQKGATSGFVAADSAVAEVRRNGIVI